MLGYRAGDRTHALTVLGRDGSERQVTLEVDGDVEIRFDCRRESDCAVIGILGCHQEPFVGVRGGVDEIEPEEIRDGVGVAPDVQLLLRIEGDDVGEGPIAEGELLDTSVRTNVIILLFRRRRLGREGNLVNGRLTEGVV